MLSGHAVSSGLFPDLRIFRHFFSLLRPSPGSIGRNKKKLSDNGKIRGVTERKDFAAGEKESIKERERIYN